MDTRKNATKPEVDESISALISNASAIRAITGAVESTLGPKGLDTMLVDRMGDIIITNAGVTILDRMEVSHPAARMLINIARSQHDEIGDGTTTATIMAGTLIQEGLSKILKGVPVTRIIDGIQQGINFAMEELKQRTIALDFPGDPLLKAVALIAGREDEDIADKSCDAAKFVGFDKLMDPSFKLKETVVAIQGAENEVFEGIILKKKPVNDAIPTDLENVEILCFDDSLEVEKPQEGSLNTEIGFKRFIEKQREFDKNLKKIIDMRVRLIMLTRGLSDRAEEILTEAGVLIISRLTSRQMRRICEHIGATALKKSSLENSPEKLKSYTGGAQRVFYDKRLKNTRILGGKGKPIATFLVGAPTDEVVEEKERIACDALSSTQAATRGGVIPGGGVVELAISRKLAEHRNSIRGMSAHGIDCVIEALKKPISQITRNAGFNPLEKVEEVASSQVNKGNDSLGLDCETGQVIDMLSINVVDPTLVKLYALKAAGEVARAILRINTIIKMRDEHKINSGMIRGHPG